MRKLLQLIWFVTISFFLLTSCEEKEELTYLKGQSTVVDIDGNVYKTIIVAHPFLDMGDQEWMAENLEVTHFNNGNPIYKAESAEDWRARDGIAEPSFAWYNFTEGGEPYGAYYNFYAVTSTEGLCPTGWRVPTIDDLEKLNIMIGGRGKAGGKLKSTTNDWAPPNTNASDIIGFRALPGGYLNSHNFEQVGECSWFWTSTPEGFRAGYAYNTTYNDEILGLGSQPAAFGRPIRCVKE